MRAILLACALLLFLAGSPALATSYVPMSDEALVDQAPVIAVVAVQGSAAAEENGRPGTEYRVKVERVLKGKLPGNTIAVRVPGGVRSDGIALKIWGAPVFSPDGRALLFLSPRKGGAYSIVHLMLGAFHEVRTGGSRLAVRYLAEARAVARPGEPLPAEGLRDFDAFSRWVAARARGVKLRASYRVPATSGRLNSVVEQFRLMQDNDGYNLRWFEFDRGDSVVWYAHEAGQAGLPGGGFAEFQAAMAAWSSDPATNISYVYGGTTANDNGFLTADTQNVILFNDPNDEVSPFSCGSGGVLAIGGPWYDTGTLPHQGIPRHPIVNADVIINSGLDCYLRSSVAEEIFGHELGHTLGLSHSSLPDALMYRSVHNDNRGAQLSDDDRAGIAALYAFTPPATSFFTLPPCRLLDTREPDGPHGGPRLGSGLSRSFAAAGRCGIPASATAIAVNVTAVSSSAPGHLTFYPTGDALPNASTINFNGGTRANNAILRLSGTGSLTVTPILLGTGTVDLIVDVNGYFE